MEIFLKIQNEMNILPYVTIIDNSINRENFLKSQNKIFPINGTQLYKEPTFYCKSIHLGGESSLK